MLVTLALLILGSAGPSCNIMLSACPNDDKLAVCEAELAKTKAQCDDTTRRCARDEIEIAPNGLA